MIWQLKKCWYRIYQKVLKLGMCFMDWSEPVLFEGEGAVIKLASFVKNKGIIVEPDSIEDIDDLENETDYGEDEE